MEIRNGSSASPPRRLLLATVFFLLVVAVLGWRTLSRLNQVGDAQQIGMQDFRDAVYFPVVSFLAGENPYDTEMYLQRYPALSPFPLYAPTTLLLHIPFGVLPQRVSEGVYFFVTVLLTLLLAGVSLRIANLRVSAAGVLTVGGLVLISRPGHQNLLLGQLTLPIAICSILALQMSHSRPWVAGVCGALAVGKPTFGIPILGLLLLRRDYRAFAYACGIAFIVNMSVLLLIAHNNGGVQQLFASLMDNASGFQSQNPAGSPVASFSRIDILTTVARITGNAGPGWLTPFVMVSVMLLTGWVIRLSASRQPMQTSHTTLGLPCLATLLCVYHQPHEILLMVPFMACLWAELQKPDRHKADALSLGLLTAVFANYAATAPILQRIGGPSSSAWVPITSINGIILLIVFTIGCSRAVTHRAAHGDPEE